MTFLIILIPIIILIWLVKTIGYNLGFVSGGISGLFLGGVSISNRIIGNDYEILFVCFSICSAIGGIMYRKKKYRS